MTFNLDSQAFVTSKGLAPIFLKPGEKIPQSLLDDLKKINETFSRDRNFTKYEKTLETLFGVSPFQDTNDLRIFLGGFVAGDGSVNVSAKKDRRVNFKLVLDPEFSASQHINGVELLIKLLFVLKTGRISHKQGSPNTMVLTVGSRTSLVQKVVPFYDNYVCPFCGSAKEERFKKFKKMLDFFETRKSLDRDCFRNEMLPLWDEMRMQPAQANASFKDLQEAQNYFDSPSREFLF